MQLVLFIDSYSPYQVAIIFISNIASKALIIRVLLVRQEWIAILYNWLIWRALKLAFFFKKEFSLYLFWRPEQSEQRHLYVNIFLCDL